MKFLLYIWQLPQNILGYVKSRKWKCSLEKLTEVQLAHIRWFEKAHNVKIYVICQDCKNNDLIFQHLGASSLGKYICVTNCNMWVDVPHEHGHCRQSLRLGWLYLPIVGTFSGSANLKVRRLPANWPLCKKLRWYYTRWTEKWADKLGGVDRDAELARLQGV